MALNCRQCNSTNTRVIHTKRLARGIKRYCRCLECLTRYRTLELYEQPKPGRPPGYTLDPGKVKRGVDVGTAVLTEQNITQIRELSKNCVTYAAIAKRFGIHKDTVYRIVNRKTWSHIP